MFSWGLEHRERVALLCRPGLVIASTEWILAEAPVRVRPRPTSTIPSVCAPAILLPLAADAMTLSRLAFLAHPAVAPIRRPRVRLAVHRCRPSCPGVATVVASTAGRQVQQASSSSSLSSSSSSTAAVPSSPSRSTAPSLTDRERVLQRQASIAGTHWARALRAGDTVVDATCGRGRDTLRLAQMLALASSHGTAGGVADGDPYAGGRVVAIDIQVRLPLFLVPFLASPAFQRAVQGATMVGRTTFDGQRPPQHVFVGLHQPGMSVAPE